jgi:hypothetical protein
MTFDPSLPDLADGAAEAIRALNQRTVLDRQLRDGQLVADAMTSADAAALVGAVRRSARAAGCHGNELGQARDAGHEAGRAPRAP